MTSEEQEHVPPLEPRPRRRPPVASWFKHPESGWSDPEPPTTVDREPVGPRFRAAWRNGGPDSARPDLLPLRLARACASVLPVDGAGVSLLEDDLRVPLGASDELASLAERLQFTQGEGPCLHAAERGQVLAVDAVELQRRWPTFAAELFARTPFRAIITIPLAIDPATRGAIDLFLRDRQRLWSLRLADAVAVSEAVVEALQLSDEPGVPEPVDSELDEPIPAWAVGPSALRRRYVWIAVGTAMVAFDISAPDALAVLRAYAYARGAVLDDVALALVEGRLDPAELRD